MTQFRRKLLCVVAHPDDECFAFGGALALAADAGVETSVICFTDGQAATNRGAAASGEELGAMRRAEFVASCDILGVTHHELLDYQDAQLEFADFSATAARLVERIRRFRPHVVLTFGGDGAVNTHPDHTMVSTFTTAAFHWAAQAKRFPRARAHSHRAAPLLRHHQLLLSRPPRAPARALDRHPRHPRRAEAQVRRLPRAHLAGPADGSFRVFL
jgi:LmbE family N-acetylglucosaminyl deacetylase